MMNLPNNPTDSAALLAQLQAFKGQDLPARGGRVFAYNYEAGEDVDALVDAAYTLFLKENALDPTVTPSAMRLENEVVAMVASKLGGDARTVGTFTSGGTESVMLACLAARRHAEQTRPEVVEPEIVLPVTAHASFHKAASFFRLKSVLVDVDVDTFRVDPAAVAAAITPNTIMLVGSAPAYAHGACDPIPALGALAQERGLWLHVDACIGGWVLAMMPDAGEPAPAFDMSVPGVTSLSVDLHKYGYAAKGASVLLYADAELRLGQWFASSNWTGYTVINPTLQSTKSAGPVAAAWAVLKRLGTSGYVERVKQMRAAARDLADAIEAHPDLRLLARPETTLMSFTSPTVGIFHIIDEMRERGWYIQPQLSFRHYPANIHLSVNPGNCAHIDAFLRDLGEAVDAARPLPVGEVRGQLGSLLGRLGEVGLSPEVFPELLAAAGVTSQGLPERMAGINELLDALPPTVREQVLIRFLNGLYLPS